jgi:MFS family permease
MHPRRGVTRDLRLVSLSLLLWGLGEGMFIYFQPLYLHELGASPLAIGGIIGMAGLSLTFVHIPAGAVADHFGRKTIMTASWLIGTLATLLMFLAPSLSVFATGMVIYYTTAFVMAPMNSYVTAARGAWPAARALTTSSAAYSAGVILGPVCGGLLGDAIGLRAVYGLATIVFVVSTGLILLIHPQPTDPADETGRYRALLANRALARLLGATFICMLGMYLYWPLTPNFLQTQRDVSLASIGLFGSFNGLGVVAFNLTLGRMAPAPGFVLAQILVGISCLALWQGVGLPWYALGYFLAGGLRTARSLMTAMIDSVVERSQVGLAFGLSETVVSLMMVLAAPLAGALYSVRPSLPYPVNLGITGLAIVLSLVLLPRGLPERHIAPVDLSRIGGE